MATGLCPEDGYQNRRAQQQQAPRHLPAGLPTVNEDAARAAPIGADSPNNGSCSSRRPPDSALGSRVRTCTGASFSPPGGEKVRTTPGLKSREPK